jgi:REP element-mobilizing transposase RayT
MPNHFHFLIKTKSEEELLATANLTGQPPFGKFETFQKFASRQFASLFSSYTQAFNKKYDRRGSLFISNFKKKEISTDAYLTAVIIYIHRNPIHHGFCEFIADWPYSSYTTFLSEKKTKVQRQQVLDWFGSKQVMVGHHRAEISLPDKSLLIDF